MRRSELFFHPLSVSIFSLGCVLSYAVWMRWRFPGGDLRLHYFYVLPIIVPFVAFLFDRAHGLRDISLLQCTIEVLVIAISILRMLGLVPLISGHALFLTYAMASPVSRLTRITAALVMIQVIYLKLVVWHDFITPFTGISLGLLTALVVRRFGLKSSSARPIVMLSIGIE
jgi:hypothetical protein